MNLEGKLELTIRQFYSKPCLHNPEHPKKIPVANPKQIEGGKPF